MKLSDNENCFAAYYNLGICQRTMGQHEKAVEYFETGLEWARQKGKAESECITLGQLAVTYKAMEYYQKAVEHFEVSQRRLSCRPTFAGDSKSQSSWNRTYIKFC